MKQTGRLEYDRVIPRLGLNGQTQKSKTVSRTTIMPVSLSTSPSPSSLASGLPVSSNTTAAQVSRNHVRSSGRSVGRVQVQFLIFSRAARPSHPNDPKTGEERKKKTNNSRIHCTLHIPPTALQHPNRRTAIHLRKVCKLLNSSLLLCRIAWRHSISKGRRREDANRLARAAQKH